jgi:AraC-like DNA-binding protein
MSLLFPRRHVDWQHLPAVVPPQPLAHEGRPSMDFAPLLSAFRDLVNCAQIDELLRLTVEFARDRIGLARVALFLRDDTLGLMRGTWGTDLEGRTVDEHFITFDIWSGERLQLERDIPDGVYWTVVENAPHVVHTETETRVVGHGWVCCTPVYSASEIFGTMFNDGGLTGESIDDAKQSKAALLCSFLASTLDSAKARGKSLFAEFPICQSAVVARAMKLLDEDPTLTAERLGERLRLSASRIAKLFKAETGISVVEYRNRLRLERFNQLVDRDGDNLLKAALDAGFGSYAQFHRVFVAHRGSTPSHFIQGRHARTARHK